MFHIFMNPYFHEYDITQFVLQKLESGDLFIDVGAMGGLYCIIASHLVGPTGSVLAIEPHPQNVSNLLTNLHLNNLSNVHVIPKAVGEREAIVSFYRCDERTEQSSLIQGNCATSTPMAMVTVDSLVHPNLPVKILKIDTEGYDYQVLQGASRTLQNTDYVITETLTPNMCDLLEHAGFRLTSMHPSQYYVATRTK
jgi:FkbM family methyltransferase